MNARGPRRRVARGIYEDACGFSVEARIGTRPNELRSPEVRFPLGTPLDELKARWHREKMRLADRRRTRGTTIVRGTLAADVPAYFKTARLSPQRIQERTQQLQWWCAKFGHRLRTTLEATELTQALNTLNAAASTVNKYRTALSNLFTVLDGKNASNPFRDVPKQREPEAARLDQPYELIQVILAKIRDRGHGVAPSRTKAFLRVRAYAPVTPAQLPRLQRSDVHWETSELSTPGRHKGQGTRGRRKPLSPEALDAFRAFDAAGCWGLTPSRSSIWRTFTRARDAAIAELQMTRPDLDLSRAETMAPKDLRHSFAAVAFAQTGSLSITGQLLDHMEAKTTLRYAQGAVPALLKTAGAAIASAFAQVPPYVPPPPGRAPGEFRAKVPRYVVDGTGQSRRLPAKSGVSLRGHSAELMGDKTAKQRKN